MAGAAVAGLAELRGNVHNAGSERTLTPQDLR